MQPWGCLKTKEVSLFLKIFFGVMGDVRECPTNAIPHNSGIVFDRCVIEQLQGIVRREKGGFYGRRIEAGNSLHFMKVTNHFNLS